MNLYVYWTTKCGDCLLEARMQRPGKEAPHQALGSTKP